MNTEQQKQINRTNLFTPLSNESGAVLIITLIILVLLTLIGVSGINTASTDIQITSNYRIHNLNLSCADAAVNRAKSLIAYGNATTSAAWVNDIKDLYDSGNGIKYFKVGTVWKKANYDETVDLTPVLNVIDVDQVITDWDNGTISAIAPTTMPGDADVEFVVYVDTNSADGESVVIARSRKNGGDVIIEAGFNQK
ncbi:MAG: PilX N-terminal domain-containing pilus assembly protein [Desulfobacter postgatei]|uniref:PilX N-terminal domain-containing pilus assembly protein n=1 Tax=Desulfobacter postgatei TaxID=2293 RepID=UPI0023F5637C|nr:PilX N-terminal domain-containing pilus assembly protein [Desulfobacter postgatei]MDD4274815.1 PilX N-terminal domain-containing pilus assembly protein [Desulfobacter postgatei]